jgi:hypothetical protein
MGRTGAEETQKQARSDYFVLRRFALTAKEGNQYYRKYQYLCCLSISSLPSRACALAQVHVHVATFGDEE